MPRKAKICPHCQTRNAPAREKFCEICRNWMDDADETPITLTMPRWAWQSIAIILETISESGETDPCIRREINHVLRSIEEQ